MQRRTYYRLLPLLPLLLAPRLLAAQKIDDPLQRFFDLLELDYFTVMRILFILLLTWGITRLLKWGVDWLADRYRRYRLRIWSWYPRINVLIWLVVIFAVMRMIFPDDRQAVWAFLASSTIVVGVAAQDTLKNIFGGLWLIAEQPFQLGDRINFGNYYGKVEAITLSSTKLRTLDDSVVTVPNASIFSQSVSNANDGALDCMVVVDLWLPHAIDITKAKHLATEATITSRYLNYSKPVQLLFNDHYDQQPATRLSVKAYVLDAQFEKIFATEVTEATKKAFLAAGLYG